MSVAIVWFRRDLRLADNPALDAARRAAATVIPLYIDARDEEAPWTPGAASCWWLHHSLAALDASLKQLGSRLTIRIGPSEAALQMLIDTVGATHVFWNRLYEPAIVARDTALKSALRARGVGVESFNANQLAEPWTVATLSGGPYRVFTPFWRTLSSRVKPEPPLARPSRLGTPVLPSMALDELGLRPTVPWDREFPEHWLPGEAGAAARLERFIDEVSAGYRTRRDRPDDDGTSKLSPHLHFGELSPRQIVYAFAARGRAIDGDPFIRELGWREFSTHLLHHFPTTPERALNPAFDTFPWAAVDASQLRAWQRGRTGVPIVDAGMRQLWRSGFMHNRVRMVVASFLTKNLRYDWRHGAAWFWDTLADADLANNTQGWQWSAGSGADAAPYFRIFNPVLQGQRFDPEGHYVKRWVPELARLGPKAVHQPWTLKPAELAAAGIADSVYARPIVDLAGSRDAALAAYRSMRGERVAADAVESAND